MSVFITTPIKRTAEQRRLSRVANRTPRSVLQSQRPGPVSTFNYAATVALARAIQAAAS